MAGESKKPRSNANVGIHHANIKNPKKAVKRLRAAFRKIEVPLHLDASKEIVRATAVLTEISPRSINLFCSRKLKKKTNITVMLKQPLPVEIRGVVKYCEELAGESAMRIENDKSFFRMYVEFTFGSEAERNALKDLYQQIRDENYVATQWHIYVTEKMQNQKRIQIQAERLEKTTQETAATADLATSSDLVDDATGKDKSKKAA